MDPIERSVTDTTLRLHDGRTVGYVEVGQSDGPATIYFHGEPSSRLEAFLVASQAASAGVRVIGLDLEPEDLLGGGHEHQAPRLGA